MTTSFDVIIIGAGAAGLMCAIESGKRGKSVLLIDHSKKIYQALSLTTDTIRQEEVTRRFAFHSVVSKTEIRKGEKLNQNNLTTKRPGTGDFLANQIKKLYGKTAKVKINKNVLIRKNYLK